MRKGSKKRKRNRRSKSSAPKKKSTMIQLLDFAQANLQKAANSTCSTIKKATVNTGSFCATKSSAAGSKTKQFFQNIKLGQKVAEEIDEVSLLLKDTADKAELLNAAYHLEQQAKTIRAIARSM
jgi:hypothetical protein